VGELVVLLGAGVVAAVVLGCVGLALVDVAAGGLVVDDADEDGADVMDVDEDADGAGVFDAVALCVCLAAYEVPRWWCGVAAAAETVRHATMPAPPAAIRTADFRTTGSPYLLL
jgi:hypothetical protein